MSLTDRGIEPEKLTARAIQTMQRERQITDLQACALQAETEAWAELKAYSKTIRREK